jgi:signal recognition particle GTPase
MDRTEYMKKYHEKYSITHKKELLEYRQNHKEEQKQYQKKYRKLHKKSKKKYMRQYYLKNKSKIIQQHKKYQVNKRKIDINFRILDNLRSRLHDALYGYSKSTKTLTLIGCDVKKLRQYLEKQFTKNMSWDNYGKNGWVIDHIRPCASFDLSKPEEQRKCFNYTNLQPLWAEENRRKGAK